MSAAEDMTTFPMEPIWPHDDWLGEELAPFDASAVLFADDWLGEELAPIKASDNGDPS